MGIKKLFKLATMNYEKDIMLYIEEASRHKGKLLILDCIRYSHVEEFAKNRNTMYIDSDNLMIRIFIYGVQEEVYFTKEPKTGWGVVLINSDYPVEEGIHDFRLYD